MQVLGLDLLLRSSFRPVQRSQLRDVVKHLSAVVLHVLHRVEAEVYLSQQRQVLDEPQLRDLPNLVQGHI